MSQQVPASSRPWSISPSCSTLIRDVNNNTIVNVSGSNEQAVATAALIVRCVNHAEEYGLPIIAPVETPAPLDYTPHEIGPNDIPF